MLQGVVRAQVKQNSVMVGIVLTLWLCAPAGAQEIRGELPTSADFPGDAGSPPASRELPPPDVTGTTLPSPAVTAKAKIKHEGRLKKAVLFVPRLTGKAVNKTAAGIYNFSQRPKVKHTAEFASEVAQMAAPVYFIWGFATKGK